MLSAVEQRRLILSRSTETKRKSQLGQFLTPSRTARFMAALFTSQAEKTCHLLDPGAGIGSLSSAFLERCALGGLGFDKVEVTAFELDATLHKEIEQSLSSFASRIHLSYEIMGDDFVEEAVNRIQFRYGNTFTHAILNPPYKKINSGSRYRLLLRHVGIETVNLYSAFLALALELMAPGAQIVAIIPRSFCNGPYYLAFRKFLLERVAIRHLHLFETRNRAFRDDDVLQENLILMLDRSAPQGDVVVTTSTDDRFADLSTHVYPFDSIVCPGDPEHVIHVPTSPNLNTIDSMPAVRYSLDDIGISVSTGPIVDFRLKEHLRKAPGQGTAPLLYPSHFRSGRLGWPRIGIKKPNAILRNDQTERWLFPKGFYCVVRRFSSKEEKRRVVASVVEPDMFPDIDVLGFENHLNVFHENKRGLPEFMARGLALYLNSTAVDEHFRRFSGHTQVNATDLRRIKYPSRAGLIALGEWSIEHQRLTQAMIDEQLSKVTDEQRY